MDNSQENKSIYIAIAVAGFHGFVGGDSIA